MVDVDSNRDIEWCNSRFSFKVLTTWGTVSNMQAHVATLTMQHVSHVQHVSWALWCEGTARFDGLKLLFA